MRLHIWASVLMLSLAAAWSVLAQPGKGNQHGGGNPHVDSRGNSQANAPPNFVVREQDRTVITTYYRDEFARGNCPPGLAKKGNGCLPPGQAKAWALGQPLPAHVVYYPLPQPLYGRLAPPPMGYEYVRVDDDVLLMDQRNRSIVSIVVNLR